MKRIFILSFFIAFFVTGHSQAPKTYTSAEILLQIKKLNVLGSVLYIAAHPDDENTRLLAYLANEKLYRTGYLSITRGDGGQNLIGDEQGVDLGLIRTQELLAARRIDGAEQFFTSAFDFGFSKSPEETFKTWGHDKVLADVVWVIRKFRPDVIISRFPTTGEGGHGHHTASAILASEAFDAAADPQQFPEQLKHGVSVWQAKRILWNTFNFGGTVTQREDQFKMDCGDYNPILGKSYGEIAATSRSQHKSQGFGVPAQRGSVIEYFKAIKGETPTKDLMEGVNTNWERVELPVSNGINTSATDIRALAESIYKSFSVEHPERSVPALVKLYTAIERENRNVYWREQKLEAVKMIIENAAGIFMDATTNTQFAVQGDSLKINLVVNNRIGDNVLSADAHLDGTYVVFEQLKKNVNATKTYAMLVKPDMKLTQPYWLQDPMNKGSFNISDQRLVGKGESDPLTVVFSMMIEGKEFEFTKPIRYKFTDPVKGELYQPVTVLPRGEMKYKEDVTLAINKTLVPLQFTVKANLFDSTRYKIKTYQQSPAKLYNGKDFVVELRNDLDFTARKGVPETEMNFIYNYPSGDTGMVQELQLVAENGGHGFSQYRKEISYDHIPAIVYFHKATTKVVKLDLKTEGNYVGYIPGAGDKVPEALIQMGYKVVTLQEKDLVSSNLRQFDAIVTGVRAYNVHAWLSNRYDALMDYVKEGGVLLSQYNTNNSIGPVRAKISPYPFTISRSRITDEEAKVNFLLPAHPALNTPNKITQKDFEGWIQERSIYHAEAVDSNYKRILSMQDPGEKEHDGSLIIANYGKGRFVYTGLVFFRELPAGVPGAYRLFANLIANKRTKYVK